MATHRDAREPPCRRDYSIPGNYPIRKTLNSEITQVHYEKRVCNGQETPCELKENAAMTQESRINHGQQKSGRKTAFLLPGYRGKTMPSDFVATGQACAPPRLVPPAWQARLQRQRSRPCRSRCAMLPQPAA